MFLPSLSKAMARGRAAGARGAASGLAATVVVAATGRAVWQAFVFPAGPRGGRRTAATARPAAVIDVETDAEAPVPERVAKKLAPEEQEWEGWNEDVHGGFDAEDEDLAETNDRTVKVTEPRDIAELLKLPNPLRPTTAIRLAAITLDSGVRLERPSVDELRKLKPTKVRPVFLHWKDKSRVQAKAPREHDEFIRRLLNVGPDDCEELVRANWKQFDKGFFFRLTELREDAPDPRMKQKLSELEKRALEIVAAADRQMRKSVPQQAEDAKDILSAMLESDGETLLWPPPKEAYKRLAERVTKLAIRAKYDNGWFETVLEIMERYGKKMEVQDKKEMNWMTQIVMQRCITEWLRQDTLWEETKEGAFIYRLMSLSHDQWPYQMAIEDPLNPDRLRDELKIISENKVMQLPMGSKLQIYAAKYLQGLVEFLEKQVKEFATVGGHVAR